MSTNHTSSRCRLLGLIGSLVAIPLMASGLGAQELRFSSAFSSSMVLQRDRPLPVWGMAQPSTEVVVEAFGQRRATRSDADGRWQVSLDPVHPQPAPGTVRATCAGAGVSLDDVLIGDVWIITGAGFMRPTDESERSKDVVSCPQVRFLKPDHYRSLVPVAELPGPSQWRPLTMDAVPSLSLSWQLGRSLHNQGKTPIGLIIANRDPEEAPNALMRASDKSFAGAQRVAAGKLPDDIRDAEAWLAAMDRRRDGDPIDLLIFPTYIPFEIYGGRHPRFDFGESPIKNVFPSTAYNTLVSALAPMGIRGVVLSADYKAGKGQMTDDDFTGIIKDWRSAWGRPELPFVVLQPSGDGAARIAEGVRRAEALPAVRKVPFPAKFSERDGADLWEAAAVAGLATKVDAIVPVPVQEPLPAAAPVALPPPATRPELETAHVFADHMVLQADAPLKVWGWAAPKESITVTVGSRSGRSSCDDQGRWSVVLEALPAGEQPLTMTVEGDGRKQQFNDVLVGEVWLNSGQSNSGFTMSGTLGFEAEKPKANHPTIRMFRSISYAGALPQRHNFGFWVAASPETVGKFSGMGYYFAKSLQERKHVPVGIIEANHGGSFLRSWSSDEALRAVPTLAEERAKVRDEMQQNLPLVVRMVREWVVAARSNAKLERPMPPFPVNASPMRPWYNGGHNPKSRRGAIFYNGVVQPMAGYRIRGMMWNQGEADTTSEYVGIYDRMLQAMVGDLRKTWGYEFPFYLVQMPALQGRKQLLDMWQAQARAVKAIPNCALTVSNDIAEPERGEGGIHPRDKKTVAERMVRLAMSRVYGVADPVDCSPMMTAVARDGAAAVVTFAPVGDGLKTRDGKPSDSWELAGEDGTFHPATAVLSGATATVSAPGVTKPATVRLGWTSVSNANLVNSAGLPAYPFTARVP